MPFLKMAWFLTRPSCSRSCFGNVLCHVLSDFKMCSFCKKLLSRLKSISTQSCFCKYLFPQGLGGVLWPAEQRVCLGHNKAPQVFSCSFPHSFALEKQTRKEQCDAGYYHIKLCSLLQFPLFVLCGKTNTKRTIRCRVLSY